MKKPPETAGPILHENLPLLEVSDPQLLDQLQADPATAFLLLTRLSDRVVAVAPDKFDALVSRLRKTGHYPKISG